MHRIPENGAETLHIALRTLGWTHRRRACEEFAKIGLTEGQPKVLSFLTRNDGCIQREIAVNCHIKPSTVTSILTNMERAGLIRRASSTEDKRIQKVFLTEKGIAAHEEIEKVFCHVDEECFEGFTEAERKQTLDLLNRLGKNLKKRVDNDV